MKKLKKDDAAEALRRIEIMYPDVGCALNFGSPFQLLVAVSLSAQTTDKKVNQITDDLFRLYPTAFELAEAKPSELEEQIHSIGLYRNKAKNIKAMSQILVERYEGQVPEDQALLEELPGVGHKTANVVMSVAFGHQRIAVDTHVFRVSNRIGFVDENNVTGTEKSLQRVVPKDKWSDTHHRLIWHGRLCCTARKPHCSECLLDGLCLKKGM